LASEGKALMELLCHQENLSDCLDWSSDMDDTLALA